MKQIIQIRCKNNKKTLNIEIGSTLSEVFDKLNIDMPYGPISAKVNNKVEGMHFRLYHNKDIEFLDMHSSSGSRAYTRTLFFVLCKAVHDLYPDGSVVIDIPVSNGYYCDLKIGRAVTTDDCNNLRRRMEQIIAAAIPITRHEAPTEDVMKMFATLGTHSKVELLRTSGRLYTTYYDIDGYVDYFYGTLLTNTSQLYLFGLEKYYDGLLLRIPSPQNAAVLGTVTRQDKMFEIFKEHHCWQDILGMGTVGAFNAAVEGGLANSIVNVSEALQEKKIAHIAEQIAARQGVKMVLIAGPSSSGKTTTCKRLSIQLLTCGIRPVPISLDDYFVDREQTPRQPNGDYDYERIHALNPELTAQIPDDLKFRVYASALTTILLDPHNYIPTTDNRLLRRIIRDYKYRGCSAQDTIRRWPSVRAGENKWIFPYQENADVMFNTAMIYELAVIKKQADPVLEAVPENCEEYAEAYRLRKFLSYFHAVDYDKLPPTSLLREFLGGSTFTY